MKILTVSEDYLPNVGGVAAHVHQLTQALAAQGHEVVVIKSDWGDGPHEIKKIGPVEAHYLRLGRLWLPKVSTFLRIRKTARYIAELHRQRRFDVLHWHHFPTSCLETMGVCRDIPRIFTNHTSMYLEHYYAHRYRKLRFYLGHADWIIAPSRELVEASYILLPPERCTYIPNGVDAQQFNPTLASPAVRQRFNIPADAPLIVSARRLVPKNGVIFLARAAAQILSEVPQARILIVGDGPERSALERELQSPACRDKVIFAGSLPNEQLPAILASSDIATLPSLLEATSIFGLEAMACGCALVGTRVGGIPEIIDEGRSGLLVPPEDPAALAEAILSLIRDRARCDQFKRTARQIVQDRFTWTRIAQETVEVYQRAGAALKAGA